MKIFINILNSFNASRRRSGECYKADQRRTKNQGEWYGRISRTQGLIIVQFVRTVQLTVYFGSYEFLNVLLRSNISCLDFSCSLVINYNNSTWCNSILYYFKCCRNHTIVKQLFSFAKRQRVNFEPELVHQVILKQQLN